MLALNSFIDYYRAIKIISLSVWKWLLQDPSDSYEKGVDAPACTNNNISYYLLMPEVAALLTLEEL